MGQTLNIREFRQTLGAFLTGVTVVTTNNEQGEPIGFTANSFASVSLDPPLVLVCLAKTSGNCNSFANSKSYAINILAENQQDISGTFASPIADRFAAVSWHQQKTGSPIIDNVAAWLDCSMHDVIDAGDHFIFIGQVLAFGNTTHAPLGYLRGNYVRFALEQEAAVAMENPDQRTCVGAIVEQNESLFLLEKDGKLQLPQASRLGNEQDELSLLGKLKRLGLHTDVNYLFAVYENKSSKELSIYYRAQVADSSQVSQGDFYAFDEIPFKQLQDEATQIMLKRYINERGQDVFGIYVGDEQKGAVEPLVNLGDQK